MRLIQISPADANAILGGNHYLGPVEYVPSFCLSTPARDAVAVFSSPIAAHFKKSLHDPLELVLGDERRKTGWMRAEAAGDPGPWRQQAVLGRDRWDADALRDLVRDYATEHLACRAGHTIDRATREDVSPAVEPPLEAMRKKLEAREEIPHVSKSLTAKGVHKLRISAMPLGTHLKGPNRLSISVING